MSQKNKALISLLLLSIYCLIRNQSILPKLLSSSTKIMDI